MVATKSKSKHRKHSRDDSDEEIKAGRCLCGKPHRGRMIKCANEECHIEWYHLECVSLENFPPEGAVWYCVECRNRNPREFQSYIEPAELKKKKYCKCEGPDMGDMIECENDKCRIQWFHLRCVGLTPATVPKNSWFCDNCRHPLLLTDAIVADNHGGYYVVRRSSRASSSSPYKAKLSKDSTPKPIPSMPMAGMMPRIPATPPSRKVKKENGSTSGMGVLSPKPKGVKKTPKAKARKPNPMVLDMVKLAQSPNASFPPAHHQSTNNPTTPTQLNHSSSPEQLQKAMAAQGEAKGPSPNRNIKQYLESIRAVSEAQAASAKRVVTPMVQIKTETGMEGPPVTPTMQMMPSSPTMPPTPYTAPKPRGWGSVFGGGAGAARDKDDEMLG